jgi:DNA-binding winged helix-turn-helix (wHTH) protein/tetratricopeptide (TPR) repeat protein
VEFRILGPLEVVADGRQVPVTGSRDRALLAILLIHAGEVVSAERLIDELWGSDLPANPPNALQAVVSRVRQVLQVPSGEGHERLVTRNPGYLLDAAPEELDARRFGQLVGQAQQIAATDPSHATLPRHQTLQAVIDWSCQLLPVPERALFGQLSVFAGGFTLEAAEEVCGAGGAELSRLVDQSLIVPGDGRFRMLDTLRRYAAERLPEPESLRRRHAEYLLRLAERAEPLLRGPQQGTWLRRLEADHDNFSVAIDWAFGHDPELAVRLSSALAYYWLIGRHRSEVRHHLAEAVDIMSGVPAASRAKSLVWAAQLGNIEGRMDQAAWQAQEAYQLAKDGEDPWLFAMSEAILGLTLGLLAETGQATELLESARARFAGIGDKWGVAVATMLSGLVSMSAAQSEQAAALTRRSLEGFRGAGDQWGQTLALELLGLLARHRGAYEDAVAGYEEALGVVRDLGLRDEIPFLLVDLGDLHVLLEDVEAAAILYQEALDLAQELGAMDAVTLARNGLAEVARLWSGH